MHIPSVSLYSLSQDSVLSFMSEATSKTPSRQGGCTSAVLCGRGTFNHPFPGNGSKDGPLEVTGENRVREARPSPTAARCSRMMLPPHATAVV